MCIRKVYFTFRLISFFLQDCLFNLIINDDAKTERKMWIFCFHWGTLTSSSQDNALLHPSFLTISFLKFCSRPWKQIEENPDSKENNASTSITVTEQKILKLICIAQAKAACPSARAQLPLKKVLCPPHLPGSLTCPRVSEMSPWPCFQAAQPSPSFPCHVCHFCSAFICVFFVLSTGHFSVL